MKKGWSDNGQLSWFEAVAKESLKCDNQYARTIVEDMKEIEMFLERLTVAEIKKLAKWCDHHMQFN